MYDDHVRYGFFLTTNIEFSGSVIWKTPSGELVEVTEVRLNPESRPGEICMGEVTKFVRRCCQGMDTSFVFIPADKSEIYHQKFTKKK